MFSPRAPRLTSVSIIQRVRIYIYSIDRTSRDGKSISFSDLFPLSFSLSFSNRQRVICCSISGCYYVYSCCSRRARWRTSVKESTPCQLSLRQISRDQLSPDYPPSDFAFPFLRCAYATSTYVARARARGTRPPNRRENVRY